MLCLYVDFKTTTTPHTLSLISPTNRYFVHAWYTDACYHISQETLFSDFLNKIFMDLI